MDAATDTKMGTNGGEQGSLPSVEIPSLLVCQVDGNYLRTRTDFPIESDFH